MRQKPTKITKIYGNYAGEGHKAADSKRKTMSYCLNRHCDRPENAADVKFCQACGTTILLRNHYRASGFLGQWGFGRTFLDGIALGDQYRMR